ncbi:MAG: enoyl-CoA hydratase/isomerase family protein [Amaricoccus sp.]
MTQSSKDQETEISESRDGPCLTLTISYPERRNPLGTDTAARLCVKLREAEADADIRAVVLTGADRHFSSGGNLKELLQTTALRADEHWMNGGIWEDLFSTLMTLAKPTVCRIRGAAMAGGCGLVAACDFAIAEDTAKFAVPEAKIGLFPLAILPALVRSVGRRPALNLALTGRTITAQEAEKIGLITAAVPAEKLDEEVADLVAQLTAIGPLTMAMGKRAFNRIAELDLHAANQAARDLRVPFLTSPELKMGIEAFLARKS